MSSRAIRQLLLLAAAAASVGCTGTDDGAVTPSGGTTSLGGNGAGAPASPGSGATGGVGGATGGVGGTTGGVGGTIGGVGGTTGGVGGATGAGGTAAGTGGTTAGNGGLAGGAGTGGATAGAGGSSAGVGGATDGGGGTDGGAGAGSTAGAGGGGGDLPHFSFFVASMAGLAELSGNPDGFGGDFRYGEPDGLTGADKICTELAESSLAGSAAKQWRAFLSVTAGPGGGPVNAVDRVGAGPWYDRLGRVVAMSVGDLLNVRPMGADPLIIDDLPNEFGMPNSDPNGTGGVDNHHVITGSNEAGELDSENLGDTCNDWTSAMGSTGKPQCGFSWPRGGGGGGGGSGSHWITGFRAHGCAPGVAIVQDGGGDSSVLTVGEGGGYGAIYCFALTP